MAIWHDVEQGTLDWHMLRCGIPTSSEFSKIITPKTGKLSTQAQGYMELKIFEWATNTPVIEENVGRWAQRGSREEATAVANYSFQTGRETSNGGFFTSGNSMMGCSPDRIAGDRLLQIKVPKPGNHIHFLLNGEMDAEFRCQLQGEMYIAEYEYNDIVSHHESLPPAIMTVARDEEFIKQLASALDQFVELMLVKREELSRRFGPFPLPKTKPFSPPPPGYGISDQDVADYFKIVAARSED